MVESERRDLINGIVSMSSVKRYHGYTTTHIQTVADHSARVSQIAWLLAYEFFLEDVEKANAVATFAVWHDFSEGLLACDVNSFIKSKNGIRASLKKLEIETVGLQFFDKNIRNLILEQCSVEQFKLLKLADTLDFGLYVWNEVESGNRHILSLLTSFKLEIMKYDDDDVLDLAVTKTCLSKILSCEHGN